MLFDTLETRRLMAAQVSVDSGGILTIQGDNAEAYESAVVQQHVTGLLDGFVEVRLGDGVSETTSLHTTADLTGIFIDLGDGEAGLHLIVHTLPVIARTGSAFDIIQVENYNTEEAVAVSSGGNTDLLSVYDFGTYGSAVMTGAGDDGIKVFAASLNRDRPTLVFGGYGEDFLEGSGFYSLTEDDPNTPENEFEEVYDPGVGYCELFGDQDDDTFVTYNADTKIHGGQGSDTATTYLVSLQKVKASSVENSEIVIV